MTARVVHVELGEALSSVDVSPHREAYVVVRWRDRPIGAVRTPCPDGLLHPEDVHAAVAADADLAGRRRRAELEDGLGGPAPEPAFEGTTTVVVCTRDRPGPLDACLASIRALEPAPGEVLVVDNAPRSGAARAVASGHGVPVVDEPEPGLNRARRRAVREASGDVVLFTDDDVRVEPGWADALARPFAASRVGAATGLVVPEELDDPGQDLLERQAPFARGFERRVFDLGFPPAAAGLAGAGASMAFRRELALALDVFRPRLDAGTRTRSGGDTHALSRVLAAGHSIVYTPAAVARHVHRTGTAAATRTLYGYSAGAFAFLTRSLVVHGELPAVKAGAEWLWSHHLRQLARTVLRRGGHPPAGVAVAELAGVVAGPLAWLSELPTRRRARVG